MNTLKPSSSTLISSFVKRVAFMSLFAAPMLLSAACTGVEGEDAGSIDDIADTADDAEGDIAEAAADKLQDMAPSSIAILVHNPAQRGLLKDELEQAGVTFVADDYDTVIVHVDASNAKSLVPVVTEYLNEGARVLLDSNGGDADRIAIGELALEIAGVAAEETALSIVQDAPGAFTVVPIAHTNAAVGSGDYGAGNTPMAVLGSPVRELALMEPSMADTMTKYYFQCKGCASPPIVPSFVDNNSTYPQTSLGSTDIIRYRFKGPLLQCSPGAAANCNQTYSESVSNAVANGTSISVNFTNKLTEKLTGGVTLGYTFTKTKTSTSTWVSSFPTKPGWTSRPVSWVVRRSGKGDVKNAYIFKSRTKSALACKPSGGCYGVYDSYERQATTKVGTWSSSVVMNGGVPTIGWKTFQGNVDPNTYVMDN
ncbi:MAG: hypothetical protein R3F14_44880 [Polyangiaceae bacterium]